MGTRLDPQATAELAKLGGDTFQKCFNCGNCTAVCALSRDDVVFPRQSIRYMQLGLTDELVKSTEPWQCYYCGSCSETCPREAEPGELMMAARRWLTSKYDWTGLSRKMYTSALWEMGLLFLTALVVLALFVFPRNFGFNLLARHPGAMENVQLQFFAPKAIVHDADLILAGLLLFFLVTNALRMAWMIMRGTKVGFWTYVSQFYQFVLHGITQKRWNECDSDTKKKHWLRHWFLVTGYVSIFALVVLFLPWFQVEDASIHWTSYVGYYSTGILVLATIWIIIDRMRKKDEIHRNSHLSDWLFPILLFLTAATGILVHILRINNMPMATYVTYMVHLMIAVPMLVIEVPFGKWPHLLYRPLAVYLDRVKQAAAKRQPEGATVADAA